ncbi:hypothetical protein TSMEX_004189 [Taenia solium]|eukprot:TsM_000443400 transcript=TsM_000443400 gene=TsM_000443400
MGSRKTTTGSNGDEHDVMTTRLSWWRIIKPECDLSDYLIATRWWLDVDERAEWWHLPPFLMASSSSTSSTYTAVTQMPASQLLSKLGTTEEISVKVEAEMEPDGEKEGEG